MENKYFTTDISDIRVGYECEMHVAIFEDDQWKEKEWIKGKVTNLYKFEWTDFREIPHIFGIDFEPHFRVPYLTKEQIEAEGGVHVGRKLQSQSEQVYEFDGYEVLYTELSRRMTIRHRNYYRDGSGNFDGYIVYFYGYCRCINEFREIFKRLKIN